jgi:hypothetical protein
MYEPCMQHLVIWPASFIGYRHWSSMIIPTIITPSPLPFYHSEGPNPLQRLVEEYGLIVCSTRSSALRLERLSTL